MKKFSRRRLLGTGAGLIALAGASSAARALSLEEADVERRLMLEDRCGANAYHAKLLKEAEEALGGRSLSDAEKRKIIALLACPLCGCAVAADAKF